MIKSRIEYIDFIKSIAIFLVVWAHCIQNMGNNEDFWENPIHIFICSFHMPIFMIMSGFFYKKNNYENVFAIIKKKARQLILPCFTWSIILVLITTIYKLHDGESIIFSERLYSIVYETFTRFWFLRAVFVAYMVITISFIIFRKDHIACIVSVIFMLLLPDSLRLAMDKFMFPFFWAGYFIHKYIDWIIDKKQIIILVSITIFTTLLMFWKLEYYIYKSPMSLYDLANNTISFHHLLERIEIVSYRYLIGLFGSVFIFLSLQSIYNDKLQFISKTGSYTLGIYIIHIFIEGHLLTRINMSYLSFITYNFIITTTTSVLVIYICIFLIKLIQKNRLLNLLMLGSLPIKS